MSKMFKVDPNETFDDETVELYKLRYSSPEEQMRIYSSARDTYRGYLPIRTKMDQATFEKLNPSFVSNPLREFAVGCFVFFSGWQWIKTFYPTGYLLRASIPQSWPTYLKQRLPIVLCMVGIWYKFKIEKLDKMPDYVSDDEPDL